MAKNQVQFQKGISLPEFLSQFGTEEQCRQALLGWRWPDGFACPECGHTEHCEIRDRGLCQCNHCHRQTSVTSGTIFAHTKLPLTTWFLAMYFLTQQKNGISALALKHHFRAPDMCVELLRLWQRLRTLQYQPEALRNVRRPSRRVTTSFCR